MAFRVKCSDCGQWHYTDESCVKPQASLTVKPGKDVKPDVRARVEDGCAADRVRLDDTGKDRLREVPEDANRSNSRTQWRHRDPDAYRAYMREYMRKRRSA